MCDTTSAGIVMLDNGLSQNDTSLLTCFVTFDNNRHGIWPATNQIIFKDYSEAGWRPKIHEKQPKRDISDAMFHFRWTRPTWLSARFLRCISHLLTGKYTSKGAQPKLVTLSFHIPPSCMDCKFISAKLKDELAFRRPPTYCISDGTTCIIRYSALYANSA